jgi:phage tail sheath protein FI
MPSNLTYPGVYIEEIPSGVRTITGVSTSVTAFIGRARSGPDDKAVLIHNFAEFERIYGGIWKESYLGYVVDHFYKNGGRDALIVRVHNDAKKFSYDVKIKVKKTASSIRDVRIELEAANPGSWAKNLFIKIEADDKEVDPDLRREDKTISNLFVYESKVEGSPLLESFRNISFKKSSSRYIAKVLKFGSTLLRIKFDVPNITDNESVDGSFESKTDPMEDSSGNPVDADGKDIEVDQIIGKSNPPKSGLHLLEDVDIFNLLCIPALKRNESDENDGDIPKLNKMYVEAFNICKEKRAFLIVDPLFRWKDRDKPKDDFNNLAPKEKNMALFFPQIEAIDRENENKPSFFPPCGVIAGVMARTDTERGVWKAPAGLDASLRGVVGLSVNLTDEENGDLNKLGINCLRTFFGGPVVWGSRTLRGDDRFADEWKYIPVRRTALYIEESLYRGTQWVVFETNDETLWAQIRLNVGAFMQDIFVKGAFQGTDPKKAYFVKCDSETTTQTDIDRGIVNILVGFAPLKPAEFVVIKIQQMTQTEAGA